MFKETYYFKNNGLFETWDLKNEFTKDIQYYNCNLLPLD